MKSEAEQTGTDDLQTRPPKLEAHLANFRVNRASLGTNERDFVLKVDSLEDCEILVESIKAQRHED